MFHQNLLNGLETKNDPRAGPTGYLSNSTTRLKCGHAPLILRMASTIQPIKTALCSFGMSGWVFHAPFIAINPGFELYAVWERTKNLSQAKYPGVKIVRSLEEILEDPAVELVVVNTPNATHYEYTKKALLADKHVIVEKPFTITVAEGEELIQLAKDRNRIITVYQNRRFDADFLTLRALLASGALGRPVFLESHFDRFRPEVRERWPDELDAWLSSPSVAPPGGESFDAVGRRVRRARDKVLARYPEGTVLLVSHVTPIKTLVRLSLGAPTSSLYRMELSAASMTEIPPG